MNASLPRVTVPDFKAAEYIVVATAKGRVKRMALSDFETVRVSGLIAITLDEGDELGWARLTSGNDDLIMVTAGGNALRTKESDFRPMGRSARGVTGIKLNEDDHLTAMEVVVENASLLVVTEKGFGKRTQPEAVSRSGACHQGCGHHRPEDAG